MGSQTIFCLKGYLDQSANVYKGYLEVDDASINQWLLNNDCSLVLVNRGELIISLSTAQ